MLCTPSHTVPYQKRHTIGEGVSAKIARREARFHLAGQSVTIKGLVELLSALMSDAERPKLKNHSLTQFEGE